MSEDPVCELHDDGEHVFVIVDGQKIARRGPAGTARAGTWIMLEPGWTVRNLRNGKTIEVTYEAATIH
jgi:hypothetical protein